MILSLRRTAVAITLGTIVAGAWQSDGASQRRIFMTGHFLKVGGVPAAVESELLMPRLLAADADQLFVFDYGDRQLKAFSFDGRLKWRRGRDGSGPWEFQNPTDLELDRHGRVLITDPLNSRLTIFSRSGEPIREVRAPAGVERCVSHTSSGFFCLINNVEHFGAILDSTGTIVRRVAVPTILDGVPELAREAFVGVSNAGTLAIGFYYSDVMLVSTDRDLRKPFRPIRGPEHVPFAKVLQWTRDSFRMTRIDPAATQGVLAVAVGDKGINALFGGRTRLAGRIIDVYDVLSTQYRGSMLLPEPAERIAYTPQAFVVALHTEPLPAVTVLKWVERK